MSHLYGFTYVSVQLIWLQINCFCINILFLLNIEFFCFFYYSFFWSMGVCVCSTHLDIWHQLILLRVLLVLFINSQYITHPCIFSIPMWLFVWGLWCFMVGDGSRVSVTRGFHFADKWIIPSQNYLMCVSYYHSMGFSIYSNFQ